MGKGTLSRSSILFVVFVCFTFTSVTRAGQFNAELCARTDPISDECQTAESLTSGEAGFAVSLTLEFSGSVLVHVTWETHPAAGDGTIKRLAEDRVVLGPGQQNRGKLPLARRFAVFLSDGCRCFDHSADRCAT